MQTEQNGINQETVNRMELYRGILLQNGFPNRYVKRAVIALDVL